MTDKILSVVMANYNHARFLPVSLAAIFGQTRVADEVLVVDDGSTDDSVAVIESFAARHSSLRLLRQPHNMGLAAAVNRGFAEATGRYVVIPGADDKVLPRFFERSLDVLLRNPQAGMSSALARMLSPEGEDLGPYASAIVSREPRYMPPEEVQSTFIRLGNWIVTHTSVFRRDAVLALGGWDPELRAAGDGLLNFAISARYGACFIPEELASWRKMNDSLSMAQAADVGASLESVELLASKLARAPLDGRLTEAYFKAYWRRAVAAIVYEASRRNPYDHEGTRLALGRIKDPGTLDRLLAGCLGSRKLGRWATKLWLFVHQPARTSIAWRRLYRAVGLKA